MNKDNVKITLVLENNDDGTYSGQITLHPKKPCNWCSLDLSITNINLNDLYSIVVSKVENISI